MKGNDVLGIIFANSSDETIRELTNIRAFGSVPFGGRYRLIDFPLSNMVNSGIGKIGVVTKKNYQSLMDHLGSGKAWDLSKRRDGLFVLPPFGEGNGDFDNKIKMLSEICGFLKRSKEEYILLSDCDVVCNINYQELINAHINSEADITAVYKGGVMPNKIKNPMILFLDDNKRVNDVLIKSSFDSPCNFSLNMFLMKRRLLMTLVSDCISRSKSSFQSDIIQANVKNYKIFGYEFSGISYVISSLDSYFNANMELMSQNIRDELFNMEKPIYTKIRDDMPARYKENANVKNSLITNGCEIEGEVENSILFRGVKVSRGAKVSNCILMQDCLIEPNCDLNYVIADKNVLVKDSKVIRGLKSFPVYISKSSIV